MLRAEGLPPNDPLRSVLLGLVNPGKSAVLVIGPPGSGKSHLLDRVANVDREQSGQTGPVGAPRLFLRPTQGTRDPALAALLRSGELPLSALVSPARAGPPARRPADEGAVAPLLLVDDMDLLDASSLTLLSQALDRELIRLAGAVRTTR
ncbi:MAG: AAA family ATPase, partial [Actinomycetota bacterium]|nr:AAA family ATPase [Actinomycetota bacterium]